MLSELRAELTQVQEAIITLERLSQGTGKRKGRPPAWLSAMNSTEKSAAPAPTKKRGRPKRVVAE